ncbi:unnamed protein product [Protopolystoma xenopodis]|uniref:Uncharacterized protein n=1 Tax=Protopolystoma xenopodis TaxID=117903 RepID=A0A3S5ARU5_9PLAT|nr:unnamed protein product [Protopolystoma xenopodis]
MALFSVRCTACDTAILPNQLVLHSLLPHEPPGSPLQSNLDLTEAIDPSVHPNEHGNAEGSIEAQRGDLVVLPPLSRQRFLSRKPIWSTRALPYHLECFSCYICGRILTPGERYVLRACTDPRRAAIKAYGYSVGASSYITPLPMCLNDYLTELRHHTQALEEATSQRPISTKHDLGVSLASPEPFIADVGGDKWTSNLDEINNLSVDGEHRTREKCGELGDGKTMIEDEQEKEQDEENGAESGEEENQVEEQEEYGEEDNIENKQKQCLQQPAWLMDSTCSANRLLKQTLILAQNKYTTRHHLRSRRSSGQTKVSVAHSQLPESPMLSSYPSRLSSVGLPMKCLSELFPTQTPFPGMDHNDPHKVALTVTQKAGVHIEVSLDPGTQSSSGLQPTHGRSRETTPRLESAGGSSDGAAGKD